MNIIKNKMSLSLGIDFGTSNSGVAASDGQSVYLLPVDPKSLVPEVVKTILYITRDHKSKIGQEAVEAYYRQNINRQRQFTKKWVGELEYRGADMFYVTDLYAFIDELQPGRLIQYIKNALRTENYEGTIIFDRFYSICDLITLYLKELKSRSESILDGKVDNVTLGRPVIFSQIPLQDKNAEEILRTAAYESGFKHVYFEFEPVAAALFYEMSLDREENVLIFDFGGGTLDISIMRLGNKSHRYVYANGGIDIAGTNFDQSIINKRLLRHFGKGDVDHLPEINQLINSVCDWMTLPELSLPKTRVMLEKAIMSGKIPTKLRNLEGLIYCDLAFSFYNAVEKSKIELSTQGATVISLDDMDLSIWELYTRWQFENDIQEFKTQIENVILQTVQNSGLEIKQIDAVVKTGGSSNIPLFTLMLENIFGKSKVKTSNLFSSVSAGLAIRASQVIN